MLYQALEERCGAEGALLAHQAQREHAAVGAEMAAVLQALYGEPGPAELQGLVKRMQQLEQVGGWAGGGRAAAGTPPPVCPAAVRWPATLTPSRRPLRRQAFIAHQLEEEAHILPRIAAALPGGQLGWWRQRRRLPPGTCNPLTAAACPPPRPPCTDYEQRSLAAAFFHAKQHAPPLLPSAQAASEGGSAADAAAPSMAVDTPAAMH